MAFSPFGLPTTALIPSFSFNVIVLRVSCWKSAASRCPLRMFFSVFSHGIFLRPHTTDTPLIYWENEKGHCTSCWSIRGLTRGPSCWGKPEKVIEMPRKCVVKVVLSKEQKAILNELARRLGTSESETLRMALMDYVKELSLMKETIHRNNNMG